MPIAGLEGRAFAIACGPELTPPREMMRNDIDATQCAASSSLREINRAKREGASSSAPMASFLDLEERRTWRQRRSGRTRAIVWGLKRERDARTDCDDCLLISALQCHDDPKFDYGDLARNRGVTGSTSTDIGAAHPPQDRGGHGRLATADWHEIVTRFSSVENGLDSGASISFRSARPGTGLLLKRRAR